MKASINLEFIGADSADFLNSLYWQFNNAAHGLGEKFIGRPKSTRPWVAEITGIYPSGKLVRRFLDSSRDYSRANSKGSRGVYLWFVLEDDKLYQVHEQISWKSSQRYFVAVTIAGDIYVLTDEEAREWLKSL